MRVTIHARIRAWRKHEGLTQREVAEGLGVSQQSVWLWESGQTTPTTQHLSEFASLCGISMEKFWGDVPDEEAA